MNSFRSRLKDQSGFNLIELMIVIAIIGLLIGVGSLAWGAMIRAGNETSAQTILDRMRMYQAQYAGKNHGKFATFDQLVQSGILDSQYGGETPTVNGYIFSIELTEPSGSTPAAYKIYADPQVPDGVTATGSRNFFTSSSISTIKATDQKRRATDQDPSI